ncbi:hypothetical protein MKW92_003988 [Papaver armeniacum]|nr:hypothetical protein MKW92_003988 [Papaver armeniacum]
MYVFGFSFISQLYVSICTNILSYPYNAGNGAISSNCRFGMMSWGVLAVTYCIKQYEMNGKVADSMLVNTVLMLVYLTKFFWWEAGYWSTMVELLVFCVYTSTTTATGKAKNSAEQMESAWCGEELHQRYSTLLLLPYYLFRRSYSFVCATVILEAGCLQF